MWLLTAPGTADGPGAPPRRSITICSRRPGYYPARSVAGCFYMAEADVCVAWPGGGPNEAALAGRH